MPPVTSGRAVSPFGALGSGVTKSPAPSTITCSAYEPGAVFAAAMAAMRQALSPPAQVHCMA
jgi:hypothetical protein